MGRSNQQRALIGTDQRGIPTVLATDGDWIAADCENICTGAEDIGLVDATDCGEPGLYLWEGYGKLEDGGSPDGPVEPEVVYHGAIRKVRPEEVATLYAMKPPEPKEHDDGR